MKKTNAGGSASPLSRELARRGLKTTPQRIAIYREVMGARDHPSADTIYRRVRKALPHVSFDTVYRALNTFAELGLIGLIEGSGKTRRFEPDRSRHHHLWCLRCHAITDFHYPSFDRLPLPAELLKQCRVVGRRVVLEGICRDCIAGGDPSGGRVTSTGEGKKCRA